MSKPMDDIGLQACCCCRVSSKDLRPITGAQREFLTALRAEPQRLVNLQGSSAPAWCSPCRKIGVEAMRQTGAQSKTKGNRSGFSRKRRRLDTADAIYAAFDEVHERKLTQRSGRARGENSHNACTLCAEVQDRHGAGLDKPPSVGHGVQVDDAKTEPIVNGGEPRRYFPHSAVAELFETHGHGRGIWGIL